MHVHVEQELEGAGISSEDDPRFYGFLTRLEGLDETVTRDQFLSYVDCLFVTRVSHMRHGYLFTCVTMYVCLC